MSPPSGPLLASDSGCLLDEIEGPIRAEHLSATLRRTEVALEKLLEGVPDFDGSIPLVERLGAEFACLREAAREACRQGGLPWDRERERRRSWPSSSGPGGEVVDVNPTGLDERESGKARVVARPVDSSASPVLCQDTRDLQAEQILRDRKLGEEIAATYDAEPRCTRCGRALLLDGECHSGVCHDCAGCAEV